MVGGDILVCCMCWPDELPVCLVGGDVAILADTVRLPVFLVHGATAG